MRPSQSLSLLSQTSTPGALGHVPDGPESAELGFAPGALLLFELLPGAGLAPGVAELEFCAEPVPGIAEPEF
jgi:hypothetical protein